MVFYHVMSGDFCDALSDHCKFRLQISLKVAEKTTAYYEADTAARNYLQQLDLALADLYANCDDSQTFLKRLLI